MNHLLRELAPISEAAWSEIDQEARRTLTHFLSARRLVEMSGPHGYRHSAVPLGQIDLRGQQGSTSIAVRRVQPVTEVRTTFRMSWASLEGIDRGTPSPELDAVTNAARQAALAEDQVVFHGLLAAGIAGMADASPFEPMAIPEDYNEYPALVAQAVAQLREAAVGGPFGIALGPRCYTGVVETTEHGGFPVLEHIRLALGGPIVWAPGVDGAVVVSQRGGDYEISTGQDFSIGYRGHDSDGVDLYIEESFAFLVKTPEAAIALTYQDR